MIRWRAAVAGLFATLIGISGASAQGRNTAGGNGFPVTIGSTSVPNGGTVTNIAGLTLTNPTLVNPALGTPSSGTATNLTGLPLTGLATEAANTIVGNATSGSASPTALAIGSCSTASSAVIWTTNTGFGCNTSITAAAVPASGLTGTTLAAGVTASSLTSVGALAGGSTTTGFTVALGSSTITGTLPAANGGAGTINGALAANGSGTVSQAASTNLSDTSSPAWTISDQSGQSIVITNNAKAVRKINTTCNGSFDISYGTSANGAAAQINIPAGCTPSSSPAIVGVCLLAAGLPGSLYASSSTIFEFLNSSGTALTDTNVSGATLNCTYAFPTSS